MLARNNIELRSVDVSELCHLKAATRNHDCYIDEYIHPRAFVLSSAVVSTLSS